MPEPVTPSSLLTSQMCTKAREHYERIFIPAYQKFQHEALATPLTVLIWGPSISGGELYKKRIQIKEQLLRDGFAAVFSEDIDSEYPVEGDMSIKMREFMQACAADCIVVLQSSPGSIAEVHDFAGCLRDIAHKMLIFIDSSYRDGYSYNGTLRELNEHFGNVHNYESPKDLVECHLLGAVLKKVTFLRLAKWRKGRIYD